MAVDGEHKAGKRERREKVAQTTQDLDGELRKSVFPTNITVDELYLYRKRRPDTDTYLNDNLKIEEGTFKALKSEYTRVFRNPHDVVQSLGINEKLLFTSPSRIRKTPLKSEIEQSIVEENEERVSDRAVLKYTEPIHGIIDDNQMEGDSSARFPTTLENLDNRRSSKFRHRLVKRRTNLILEGDISHLTEYADKFIEFILSGRVKLCRTPTSIKIHPGIMDSKSETHDQFIDFEKFDRPTLCKKFSQLHLEGKQDNQTENQEKFIAFEVKKRPPLVKKVTNLHLEGNQEMIPEYKQQYVSYNTSVRPKKCLPINNLKPGGVFEDVEDEKMFGRDIHPLIPYLREPFDNQSRRSSLRRENDGGDKHENILSRASSHPTLTITSRTTPEKLDDTANKKPKSSMTQQNLHINAKKNCKGFSTNESRTGLGYMKSEEKLNEKPEYSTSYVDFPRERPTLRKPKNQLSPEGEVKYVSEQVDKYVPHGVMKRTEPFRRVADLKMEGAFECQPEYRKAYIDYLIKEKKPAVSQRRIILEIPDNDHNETAHIEMLGSDDTPKKTRSTTPKKKFMRNKVSSDTCNGHSSPMPTKFAGRRLSQIEDLAFGKKEPTATQKKAPSKCESVRRHRDVSPAVKGKWGGAQEMNGSTASNKDGWLFSRKEDPAFLVIDEIRNPTSD